MPEGRSGGVRLFTPAKVNLGLEIIGRRPDGYHELVTVLEAVSLFDVIDIRASRTPCVLTSSGVPEEDNLVTRALGEVRRRFGIELSYLIRIEKRIPEAAGLGGGSSDAGRVLAWLRDEHGLDTDTVHHIAASLGSDVPFFLECGAALARGTGTAIERLQPAGRRWYVLLTPALEIPGKTGALYRQLAPDDFTDGERTLRTARLLQTGSSVDSLPLRNAFQRPLLDHPPVQRACEYLHAAGASRILPSGAGPSVFALCDAFPEALRIARGLPRDAGRVSVATSVRHLPEPTR